MRTRDQILEVATTLFADAGYEATSLDKVAENQSFSKQTIVYHFSSKEGLLEAVIDESVEKLIEAFERAASLSKGVEGVEAIVKAVFLMATRNPEILGILREVMRLGNEWNFKVREKLEPYMQRAQAFLEVEMKAGRIKKSQLAFYFVGSLFNRDWRSNRS